MLLYCTEDSDDRKIVINYIVSFETIKTYWRIIVFHDAPKWKILDQPGLKLKGR